MPAPRANPPGVPAIAVRGQIVGGREDGLAVAVVDGRDAALALVVDREGLLSMQTSLDPDGLVVVLEQILAAAKIRAQRRRAGLS
jgi:hypothetical protein